MPLTTAQIQNAYVAFFNRPADVAGLNYWSTYAGNSADLLNTFAQSNEYKALYSGMNNTQIVNAVYQNLFGRTPDVSGLNYWVSQLDQNKLAIGNIADAVNKGALGTDASIIANKVSAASSFTTDIAASATKTVAYAGVNATGLAAVKAWLNTVTSDAATVTTATGTAMATVLTTVQSNVGSSGTTFALTTGVDTLSNTGTFTADLLFNAGTATQVQSLQTGDSITGTGSADVLNVSLNGTALTPTVTNVETINVTNYASTALTAGNITGTTTLNSNITAGTTETITGLAAGVKLGFTGKGTLTSTLASETGASDSQVYSVSGGSLGTITGSATVEKQDFISTGSAANTITLTNLTAASLANKTAVTGDQDLKIKMAGAASFTGKFIDASGMSTGKALTLSQTADQVGSTTDATNFTNVTRIIEEVRDTGTTTYTNYKSGLTLEFAASNGTNHIATNLVATNAGLTGSSDVLNLAFTGAGGSGGVGGTTNAAGIETLNILATSSAATPGTLTFTGTTTLTAGAVGKTSTIVIDGASNQAVTFTGAVTADAINASALTKTLTVTTTASQMAITGGTANDSIITGDFASVIKTGAGTDTINVSASTGTTAAEIQGGDGVDGITLATNAGVDTIVFGASTTWGDTVAGFEINTAGSNDVINLSVSNGFGVLKHGTTTSGITYGEGAGTAAGANDTIFVSLTSAGTITTVAALQAAGTYSMGSSAVGDHMVLVVANSATAFTVFDVVAGDTNALITAADTVSLIGTFSSVAAGTNVNTAADWSAASFSVA